MTKGWKQVRCNEKKTILETRNVCTVEPRFNEGPSDWQSVFAILTRSRYKYRGSFSYLSMTGIKKIVFYTEDFVIHRFIISRFYCNQGFWYFAEKKQNFAGFTGANSRKNRPISREKSQNSRKNRPISRDFRGRKVKIRRKIVRFRGILVEKSQISKDFQGQILRKNRPISREISGGKPRQETISKKQPISLDFFWQISLKAINFASIRPALFNVVLLIGIVICSFNNRWANA